LGLADGEVFAALPEGTSIERAKSFDVGGLMSRSDAIAWFTEHLTRLWRIEGTGTLVLQDIWVKPTDPAVHASHVKRPEFVHSQATFLLGSLANTPFGQMLSRRTMLSLKT
jgi:hypothetical protein